MGLVFSILIFGIILFLLFYIGVDILRIQGYIFGLIMCLLWPVSWILVFTLSPRLWKRLLNKIGIKTNKVD